MRVRVCVWMRVHVVFACLCVIVDSGYKLIHPCTPCMCYKTYIHMYMYVRHVNMNTHKCIRQSIIMEFTTIWCIALYIPSNIVVREKCCDAYPVWNIPLIWILNYGSTTDVKIKPSTIPSSEQYFPPHSDRAQALISIA